MWIECINHCGIDTGLPSNVSLWWGRNATQVTLWIYHRRSDITQVVRSWIDQGCLTTFNQPDSEIGPTNWRLTKPFRRNFDKQRAVGFHSFLMNIESIFFCDIQNGSENVTILEITHIIRSNLKSSLLTFSLLEIYNP